MIHEKHGATPGIDTPAPDQKQFATAQAEFALLGRSLHKVIRADDGCVSFLVRHNEQAHHVAAWHSVIALLARIGGAA